MKKIESWIYYKENQPKSEYKDNIDEHDDFRSRNDVDCVLTDGNLNADTIFSLWRPFRFTLVNTNGYYTLNEFENINNQYAFLKKLSICKNKLKELLPEDNEITKKLSKLFELGQTRANVMILPDRWLQCRGKAPFHDYMPYFLLECFSGGKFSGAFESDKGFGKWVENQSLRMFFYDEKIEKEKLRDLSGRGDIKCGVPTKIVTLLDNYIDILEQRNKQIF